MATTLTARLETRRAAELVVERLVQEYGLPRDDISILAEGQANSAGVAPSGSDTQAGAPSSPERDDAALNGAIRVSVELEDDTLAAAVRSAFEEFSGDEATAT